MARYRRGKKSLYEVMSKAQHKPSYHKTLEQLRPAEAKKDEPAVAKPGPAVPTGVAKWWRTPKHLQINAGRIEISIPYQLAIAILLGLVVLILLAFRLGQFSQTVTNSTARIERNEPADPVGQNSGGITEKPGVSKEALAPDRSTVSADSEANNRIVIQTFQVRSHLEPVGQYFAQVGIETEIRKIGDWFYLVTKNKYQNPQNPGTDGYLIRQRIIQLGANYKAPQGYEPFMPNLFKDAYGMKFDD
jgi:hypothetical protein